MPIPLTFIRIGSTRVDLGRMDRVEVNERFGAGPCVLFQSCSIDETGMTTCVVTRAGNGQLKRGSFYEEEAIIWHHTGSFHMSDD